MSFGGENKHDNGLDKILAKLALAESRIEVLQDLQKANEAVEKKKQDRLEFDAKENARLAEESAKETLRVRGLMDVVEFVLNVYLSAHDQHADDPAEYVHAWMQTMRPALRGLVALAQNKALLAKFTHLFYDATSIKDEEAIGKRALDLVARCGFAVEQYLDAIEKVVEIAKDAKDRKCCNDVD